jgi:ribose 5-phosphate isomerase B
MKIALGSDHRGFRYKEIIKGILDKRKIAFEDFGTFSEESVDYPDYGIKAAKAVASKNADYGVLICGTGNGMAIVANKIKGIRAGLATNPEMARLTRSHNNANVLVLSEMFTPETELYEIINCFLDTAFEGGRHARRVSKIDELE